MAKGLPAKPGGDCILAKPKCAKQIMLTPYVSLRETQSSVIRFADATSFAKGGFWAPSVLPLFFRPFEPKPGPCMKGARSAGRLANRPRLC